MNKYLVRLTVEEIGVLNAVLSVIKREFPNSYETLNIKAIKTKIENATPTQ